MGIGCSNCSDVAVVANVAIVAIVAKVFGGFIHVHSIDAGTCSDSRASIGWVCSDGISQWNPDKIGSKNRSY